MAFRSAKYFLNFKLNACRAKRYTRGILAPNAAAQRAHAICTRTVMETRAGHTLSVVFDSIIIALSLWREK